MKKAVMGVLSTLLMVSMLTLAFDIRVAEASEAGRTVTYLKDGQLVTEIVDYELAKTSLYPARTTSTTVSDALTAGVEWYAQQTLYDAVNHEFPVSDWIYVLGEAYAAGYKNDDAENQLLGAASIVTSGWWGIAWGETSFYEVMLGLVESGHLARDFHYMPGWLDAVEGLVRDGKLKGIHEFSVKAFSSLTLAEKLGFEVNRTLVQDAIYYLASVQEASGNILGYAKQALRGLAYASELGYEIPMGVIDKTIEYIELLPYVDKFSLYALLLADEKGFAVDVELLRGSVVSLLECQSPNGSWEESTSETAWAIEALLHAPKLAITATIDIDPDTLNLKSKGKWITAYIQLPEDYDPADINASTILFNGTSASVLDPKYGFVRNPSEYLVDHDNDGILERMAKFDRAMVQSFIQDQGIRYGNVALTIAGNLLDGTVFEGTGTIFVNYAGDANYDGKVNVFDICMVKAHWGTDCSDTDFNKDSTTNTLDILILKANWGQVTP